MLIIGCNQKASDLIEDVSHNYAFNETLNNSDEIIIKLHDQNESKSQARGIESFNTVKSYKLSNQTNIRRFDDLFKNAQKTGYCCCPTASYSVTFLNENKQLDVFYIDTTQVKQKIIFYEGSFQYSFVIEKAKWKDFLKNINASLEK
jgi:hypothetical protein